MSPLAAPLPAPVAADPAGPEARASAAQLQVLSLARHHPAHAVANFPVALLLEGPLDAARLTQALNQVVARHPILRTHFDGRAGQVTPVVSPAVQVPVPVVDMRLLADEVREAQAFRLACEEAARPLDAQRPPLLRAQLFLLGNDRGIFILNFHRGIFDHASLAGFWRELAAAYESGLPETETDATPADGVPAASPADLAWWRDRLAQHPAPLRLPVERPLQAGDVRGEKLDLPAAQAAAVEALARREGTNAFTIFLTVFEVLLHRYAGLPEVLFGLQLPAPPVAAGVLAAPVAPVVPLRARVADDAEFLALLRRVRHEVLEIFTHPYDPAALAAPGPGEPPADLALACPVWFAHEQRIAHATGWPGLKMQELELDAGACPRELCFRVAEDGGRLSLRATFDPAVLAPAFVQRMLGHYGVLLEAAVARPHTRIAALPLLSVAEQRRLTCEWNNTRTDYPRDATAPALVAARAALEPTAPAGPGLGCRAFDLRSNQLARHLRAAGVRPGSCVALCVAQATDLVLGALAVMKAGGRVLLLEPAATIPQLARLLTDARVALVLTETALRMRLPSTARTLLLDFEADDILREDDADLVPLAGPEDPAWVVATLAHHPRVIELSHRALVSMVYAVQSILRLGPDDTLLGSAPLTSASAITELLGPLSFGARMERATAAELAQPAKLAARLAARPATVMLATPTQLEAWLDAGWTSQPGLRLVCRDEPLSREIADRLLRGGAEVWNLYGAAETAGVALAAAVTSGRGVPPVGRPLPNVQVHLLDAQLQPVPVGLPGDLYVGGDTLATSGARPPGGNSLSPFLIDPFRRTPSARLFRTGDRARRLPGGEIELLDRPARRIPARVPSSLPAAAIES